MRSEDIDDLWNFANPKASEEKFRSLLDKTGSSGLHAEIQTQLARSLGLQKRFDEAREVLLKAKDEILRLEEADPDEATLVNLRVARGRHLLELGRLMNSEGDALSSIRFFRMAIQISRLGPVERLEYYTVDALHMLGMVEAEEGERIRRGEEGLAVCEKSTIPRTQGWTLSILINLGWAHHDQGRFEEALEVFRRAEDWARKRVEAGEEGFVDRLRVARWTVARTLRSLERVDEALEVQLELGGLPEKDVCVFEEIAELYAAKGDMEKAAKYARVCVEVNDEVKVLDGRRLERVASLAGSS
ncbi:hypothetical protein HDU67_006831 [Dinochytrium kinnereticum]|nr:hypothetical protein HDU67_006831 [Dinochytrium kinnereticum]